MEVKFKNGDSVAIPEGCKAVVKDNVVVFEEIKQKFKKGDICFWSGDNPQFAIILGVCKSFPEDSYSAFLIDIMRSKGISLNKKHLRIATEAEKQLLIEKLHENGKDWDAEKMEIVDYRWRAKLNEHYYTIDFDDFEIFTATEDNHNVDNQRHEFRNYFKTRKLAEQAAEKVKELLLTLKHS